MSVFKNVFICGDSHAASFALSEYGRDLDFSTLGGYGIFSLFDKNTHRPVPAAFHAGVVRYFKSRPVGSTIFLSYTDTESRTGIGERILDSSFEKEYGEIVDKSLNHLLDLSSFDRLVFLDIFSCISDPAEEQTCSALKRIKNRQFVNNLILNTKVPNVKIVSTFKDPLFEDDKGVIKSRNMLVDKVHYNLDYKLENGDTISKWIRLQIEKAL